MIISLIAAIGKEHEIGYKNALLWHISADLKRFKAITLGHTVIMGRKTFESIGCKPLPGRKNLIITRQKNYKAAGALIVHSVEEALEASKTDGEVFILGGADIYRQFLPYADKMYLTHVNITAKADTWFPDYSSEQWVVSEESEIQTDEKSKIEYSFRTLSKIR